MEPSMPAQWKDYKHVSSCHICFKPFKEGNQKVRDHCHYSGIYRGAAHSLCNLQYKIPSYIPVVFHNLSGYDAHMFIKELADCGSKMGVIAKNKEDYTTFSINVEVNKYIDKDGEEHRKEINLRFIDSFKFMSSSLDSPVNYLARGNNEFFGFEDYNKSQYKLLIRKGIYPYEYMDDWDKFKETVLPPKEALHSKLAMAGVSEKDYEHARRVWSEFGINNLGEYHDLYLCMDVILLANILEAFRKVCLDNYGLDPAHFYTAPELAWKACLKKTRIRLELLLDPDMLLMFERGIRGGINTGLKYGLMLELIHRAIEFKQLAWMKEYIDFNTKLRTAAANDFEKDFYKLMNNAVFGKTMKNIRKHRNIKLITNREAYLKAVMKPNFKSGVRFGSNLMGCEIGKIKVVMNKLVYLGQAILDLSKIVMYEFHYDYMKLKYNDKDLTLCYMDTDSLIYSIETDDFCKDIADDVKDRFDTSGYNPDRPLPVGLNKKVIGLMKDELGGEIMTEFVTLRPKMYAYKAGGSESTKCKGIKKCVVRATISFEDYKNSLLGGETSYRSQLMFRSSKHEVRTLEVNKLALSRDDDKRITVNGINSLARGHHRTIKYNLYI